MQIKLTLKKPIDHYQENIIQIRIKVIKIRPNILLKLVELMKFSRTITRDKCLINKESMESNDMKMDNIRYKRDQMLEQTSPFP